MHCRFLVVAIFCSLENSVSLRINIEASQHKVILEDSRGIAAGPENLDEDFKSQWTKCNGRRAVVFNMDEHQDRWLWMRQHLADLGLCAVRYPACTEKSVEVEGPEASLINIMLFPKSTRDLELNKVEQNVTYEVRRNSQLRHGHLYKCRGDPVAGVLEWRPTSFLWNGLTQMKAWADVQTLAGPDEWVLFFEDDAKLSPQLHAQSEIGEMISESLSLAEAAGHEITYFGLCGKSCHGREKKLKNLSYSMCHGACAHSYALKGTARNALNAHRLDLIDRLTKVPANSIKPKCPEIVSTIHDPFGAHKLLTQSCDSHGVPDNAYLFGSNLRSPDADDHYGIFYQNRREFGSISKNTPRHH